jgi:hypothetical protein
MKLCECTQSTMLKDSGMESEAMKQKEIEALAGEMAKGIKTEAGKVSPARCGQSQENDQMLIENFCHPRGMKRKWHLRPYAHITARATPRCKARVRSAPAAASRPPVPG